MDFILSYFSFHFIAFYTSSFTQEQFHIQQRMPEVWREDCTSGDCNVIKICEVTEFSAL